MTIRKNEYKIFIRACLPVRIGSRAVYIQTDGEITATSYIQNIFEETDKTIKFETVNSIYHLEQVND